MPVFGNSFRRTPGVLGAILPRLQYVPRDMLRLSASIMRQTDAVTLAVYMENVISLPRLLPIILQGETMSIMFVDGAWFCTVEFTVRLSKTWRSTHVESILWRSKF